MTEVQASTLFRTPYFRTPYSVLPYFCTSVVLYPAPGDRRTRRSEGPHFPPERGRAWQGGRRASLEPDGGGRLAARLRRAREGRARPGGGDGRPRHPVRGGCGAGHPPSAVRLPAAR